MHSLSRSFLLVAVATLGLLAGCKEDPEPGTSMAGTWQLTNREGYRAPSPNALPNETVTFSDTKFYFYKDNRQTGYGTYTFASGSTCGSSTLIPVVRLTYANINNALADVVVTVVDNTLVLDYGIACDAPRETYKRLNRQ